MAPYLSSLQERLQAVAEPKIKAWWEAYLRGVIPCRGASIPTVRNEVGRWYKEAASNGLTDAMLLPLSFALLRSAWSEDKVAGITLLQTHVVPRSLEPWAVILAECRKLFEEGQINNWHICDLLCIHVLGPLLQEIRLPFAHALSAWKGSPSVWQGRATVIPFLRFTAQKEDHDPEILAILEDHASTLLHSSERFAQTAVGWVWRNLALTDLPRFERFLQTHLPLFSSEGLRYATEKLDPAAQKAWKRRHQERVALLEAPPPHRA